MLGFGALGEFALGEGPTQTAPMGTFTQFSTSARKKGLAAAVIATTFAGFVAPPQAQATVFTKFSEPVKKKAVTAAPWNFTLAPAQTQTAFFTPFSEPARKRVQLDRSWNFAASPAQAPTAIFSQFSQPRQAKAVVVGEQPQGLFETTPASPPFTGFADFAIPLRAKKVVFGDFQVFPQFIAPPDTHDGVYVKRKRKKVGPDPIDLELEEKAKRRAAIELAVYGPEVTYEPQRSILEAPPAPPPNVEELARIMVASHAAELEAQRLAAEQDDEDVLEMILRDL